MGWDLSREELQEQLLAPRESGQDLWFQGKQFSWNDSELRIYEGPATSEIENFSPILGPMAYELQNEFKDVTGEFI